MSTSNIQVRKVRDMVWDVPMQGGMRVPGRLFCTEQQLKVAESDRCMEQVANVAHLPGIVGYSMAMPDMHWGYGFPIGGVAATDVEAGGVVSPGGVGYDINCGVRVARTNLAVEDIRNRIHQIVDALYATVPCGVGSKGGIGKLSPGEEKKVLARGAKWAVGRGLGSAEDLERTEAGGCLPGADPDAVSPRALSRGADQVGTLGSGNHFLEIDVVDQICDVKAADILGLEEGQIAIQIHSGSRGFGHQVCDDALKTMVNAVVKYGIQLPDRQLACAPFDSPEARRYLAAMACAANYAWANRQAMMAMVEEALLKALKISPRELGLRLVYDVCHNIAKIEEHECGGERRRLCVHRKGATRAFGPGHPEVPADCAEIGQPVLIPGDMGTYSYVLVGTETAMKETFGSTCHGAGRVMSRHKAVKAGKNRDIQKELGKQGIYVRARGRHTLSEEMPQAYKDVNEVVEVMHQLGISRKVARLRPLGVMKG